VAQVSALEGEMQALSDDELRVRTAELQKRSRSGESLDSLLPVRILLPFSTSSQIIAIHESASF
jgi:preprotein translocase subunit SecA